MQEMVEDEWEMQGGVSSDVYDVWANNKDIVKLSRLAPQVSSAWNFGDMFEALASAPTSWSIGEGYAYGDEVSPAWRR